MKVFLSSTFKYLGYFLLGAVVAAFSSMTAVSYYAVDQVHRASIVRPESKMPIAKASFLPEMSETKPGSEEVNPNLRELTRMAKTYSQEFNTFDQLLANIDSKEQPALCSTLCNPVSLSKDRLQADGAKYLLAYYKEQGPRALQDPLFRIVVKETRLLTDVFSADLRQIFGHIQRPDLSVTDKLMLAIQLEAAAISKARHFALTWDETKKQIQNRKPLREIYKACQMGLRPKKQVLAECESQISN